MAGGEPRRCEHTVRVQQWQLRYLRGALKALPHKSHVVTGLHCFLTKLWLIGLLYNVPHSALA